jgi:hypothetical protein
MIADPRGRCGCCNLAAAADACDGAALDQNCGILECSTAVAGDQARALEQNGLRTCRLRDGSCRERGKAKPGGGQLGHRHFSLCVSIN